MENIFFFPQQYKIPTFLPVGHKLLGFNIITHPSNVTGLRTRAYRVAFLIKFLQLSQVFFSLVNLAFMQDVRVYIDVGLLDTCVVLLALTNVKVLRDLSCLVLGFNTCESRA